MKKFTYLIIAFAILFCSKTALADVVVSGITTPADMNGVYVRTGMYYDKPCYSLIDGMTEYQLFYYLDRWVIYPGTRPTGGMIMWTPNDDQHFYISSTEFLPPESGYSIYTPPMGMFAEPLAGDPVVIGPPAIPVSMWIVVGVFILAGGVLLIRHNSRKAKIA